ncbi:sushi domain-containing protein 1 isoform X1 [Lepisosteus oculatus]|uniref:sushi domain-containing protein 1 isoform X1 n=1 Tax=Lepisosteus oculatus TaxID=7918 RepID=UPI0037202E47
MSLIMSLRRIAMLSTAFVLFLTCLQLQIYDAVATSDTLDVCSSCHINATCDPRKDGTGGKMCNCLWGFMGNGRTQCIDKDECQIGTHKICGEHTVCHNTYGSFYCTCQHGYSPTNNMPVFIPNDGTFCQDIDECQVEGICKDGGLCWNVPGSFSCNCSEGYKIRNGTEPFHPAKDGAFCEEVDCGNPPILPHTSMVWNSTRLGSMVYYKCVEGFYNAGGRYASACTTNGYWNHTSIVCKEIDCGEPPVLPHAIQLWNGSTRLGSVVYYECDEGFYNAGERNFLVCDLNGYWNHTSIVCKEIDCSEPPVVPNTTRLWHGNSGLGSEVYYNCTEGFHSVGGRGVSVCTANGYWTHVSLLCKETDCGEPPLLPNTTSLKASSTKMGSIVYYKCKDGFYNAGGSNTSVCTVSGYWANASLQCKEIDCGQPPVLPHTVIEGNSSTGLGSTVYYNCKEGFHSMGGRNVSVCTVNGLWENASIVCKEIDCGDPPILPHTTIQWDTDRGPGSAVYYSCTEGFYKAEGLNISTCTLTGHWKNASLVCKEVDCGAPPVLPHACMLWNGSTGLGSVVHYECDQGFYNAGGRNFSLCTKNNRWDNVSLICEEINCGPPPVIAHTYMQWDNTTGLGSVVYYKCVEGLYQQEGKNSSICTSDRQWENITVTCKEIDCGSPPCVDHAKVLQLNGTVVGSMLQYSCKDGFISQGGTTISVCTNTGEWTAVTLLCKEKKPAISRILIFKEKCLQWQAERNGQEKEIYKVHYIGLRDYQKQFVDKKTKHFTSAKTSAEICLNLLPGTNYTINITALSAGFSSTVNLTTSIGDPPIPRLTYKDVEGPLPTLQLHKTANSNDPISFYQVFVLPLEGFSMFDCSSPSAPHCYSQDKPWGAYVAAQIHAKDIGSELVFTVGDRRYYGEYYNAPLKEGTSYYIILKIVTQWGRARKQSCVFWAKTRELSHTIQHVTIVAGGSVGLIAFVVFLGFSISWYFKKK